MAGRADRASVSIAFRIHSVEGVRVWPQSKPFLTDIKTIRRSAREHSVETITALDEGMAEKAAEFREQGGDVYRPA